MRLTYLWIDFLTVLVPFIFSFHPKLNFHRQFKYYFPASFIAASVFVLWDIYFTGLGVWGFNPKYLSGNYFINLPVEEILFFICVPFSCVFTYHSLNIFFNFSLKRTTEKILVNFLSIALIATGICFYSHLYTSVTFLSLAIFILLLKYIAKVNWFPKVFFVYTVLLIPFLIVNGILTGTGIDQPVVWYNNSETLGIRILTIPIEDIFYGFELFLLNIYLYEVIKNREFKIDPQNI